MIRKMISLLIMLFLSLTMIQSAVSQHTTDESIDAVMRSPSYTSVITKDLPETFDLRDVNGVNYVTSVKEQTSGTCWTHGTMAALESNVLMTGIWNKYYPDDPDPNFAEYHLDWWNGFNSYYNQDVDNADGLQVHMGGDYRVSSAYFTRGEGAVFDKDANDETERDTPWYQDAPDRFSEDYVIFYPMEIEWLVAESDLSNIDVIKEKIMTHGALGTCMCYSSRFIDVIDGSYCAHYQDDSTDPNHSIAIIGWDDNIKTQAPDPGAWLCKNSWGSNFCDQGYFWISYYDYHAGQHPEMGTVSFQQVVPNPFDLFYYHDYHGWRDTFTESNEIFNAFTAESDDSISAVSFYTATDFVDYTVKIYDDFENNGLHNELSMISGSVDYTGFHTVYLDEQVPLTEGDDFYVYLMLSEGGQPYDRTSEIPVLLGAKSNTIVPSSASAGESYYYQDGSWIDLYAYQFPDQTWDKTANFCIKALTAKQADLSCNDRINWRRVTPGEEVTYTISIENEGESFSQLSWEIAEVPSWGSWTITPDTGSMLTPEDGSIDLEISVIAPEGKNKEFDGDLKIVNVLDDQDYEIIPITLSTQYSSFHPIIDLLQHIFSFFLK